MSEGQPEWNPYLKECPTRQVLDRIGDRWTVLVVGALRDGPLRYTELARRIEGVSQKMLTATLRALERDGLVRRTVHPVIPPHVEYELTDLGQTLLPPLDALEAWALEHISDVLAARKRYDAATAGKASRPARGPRDEGRAGVQAGVQRSQRNSEQRTDS
ncbi:winged helix-turn-helix transcriptional regulator [Carbonactinospora thermoautotrophica]|uniref:winged helix-turn-helix transcriptional regulator n=1 Tax=Carbonactinospora thermoautotrophica TaxID=1469144 RepID=UPI00099E441D